MIEAIQVTRDVVIILSFILITIMVMVVGRAVLILAQKVEDLRVFVVDVATGVANPIKSVSLGIGRILGGLRKR